VLAAVVASVPVIPAAAAGGKELYDSKCAMCHGKDGVAKPAGKGSRNLNDAAFQAAMSVDAIGDITANGKAKMPAYRSKLTPEQIQAISAYVKTLGAPR
jgi:cytochrome c6